MGIAVKIATLLQLHREETYSLTNPSVELVMAAESARRTLVSLRLCICNNLSPIKSTANFYQ
jgi:hypothetical protein